MAFNHYNDPKLQQPQQALFIPPGKFTDIDRKYYQPTPKISNIQPPNETVNYNSKGFVPQPHGAQFIHVNYGSYVYNMISGSDPSHSRPGPTF